MSCVIYKIVHKLDTEEKDIYIGSTNDFNRRIISHKTCCYNEKRPYSYKYKLYTHIRYNGGFDNFEFKVVSTCDIENRKTIEQHYIDTLKPTLNKYNACGRDIEKKKEYQKKYDKKYYKDNKEKIVKRKKEKYTCECGSVFIIGNKSHHIKTKKHKDYINSKV